MNKDLLSLLACPKCKGTITEKTAFLTCAKCKLAYPILEGVPNMLIDDAWPLAKAQKAKFKHTLTL